MPTNQADLPLKRRKPISVSRASLQLKNAAAHGQRINRRAAFQLISKNGVKNKSQSTGDLQSQETLPQSPEQTNAEAAEAFRKWIELEVLKIMKQQIGKSDVSQQRIQDMANRTLDMIQPDMSVEKLFHSAIELNDGYPEFDSLTIKLIKEYEHKYKGKAVERVSELVKSGDLEEAQDVVKKVLEFKMI